jgi:hypothetical protein
MGLAAAAALASMYWDKDDSRRVGSDADSRRMMSSAREGEVAGVSSAAANSVAAVDGVLGGAAAAGVGGVASGGGSAVAADTPGFHEWMVRRLQATQQQFDAEQKLLQKELQMLQALSSSKGLTTGNNASAGLGLQAAGTHHASNSSGSAAWSRVKRWFGLAGNGSSSTGTQLHAAAALGSSSSEDGGGALTPAGIAARMADIREQIESLDVLKAALAAEAAEQQRQQLTAEAAQG